MTEQLLFLLFALGTCGGALAVVISQNVVRMAFWLVISLGSTAGLFFLLHADFVAATQLLVYVGGTVVLLIFGVMLTASGPYLKIKTSPADLFLAGGIGFLMLFLIAGTVNSVDWERVNVQLTGHGIQPELQGYNEPAEGNTIRQIAMKLLGMTIEDRDRQAGSRQLSTGYLLPFEIVSVHLLVVLVGAAYLARAKRRVDQTDEGE
jgi:NADH:ubiquinone oxidoreductase subunit 6 (subunit J)